MEINRHSNWVLNGRGFNKGKVCTRFVDLDEGWQAAVGNCRDKGREVTSR